MLMPDVGAGGVVLLGCNSILLTSCSYGSWMNPTSVGI